MTKLRTVNISRWNDVQSGRQTTFGNIYLHKLYLEHVLNPIDEEYSDYKQDKNNIIRSLGHG